MLGFIFSSILYNSVSRTICYMYLQKNYRYKAASIFVTIRFPSVYLNWFLPSYNLFISFHRINCLFMPKKGSEGLQLWQFILLDDASPPGQIESIPKMGPFFLNPCDTCGALLATYSNSSQQLRKH